MSCSAAPGPGSGPGVSQRDKTIRIILLSSQTKRQKTLRNFVLYWCGEPLKPEAMRNLSINPDLYSYHYDVKIIGSLSNSESISKLVTTCE